MVWLIHETTTCTTGGVRAGDREVHPAGVPFDFKGPKKKLSRLLDRGFRKLTAASAKKILAGAPEEDELDDELDSGEED